MVCSFAVYFECFNLNFLPKGLMGKEGKARLMNIIMQLHRVTCHLYLFDGAVSPRVGPICHEHAPTRLLLHDQKPMIILDSFLKSSKAKGSRVLICSKMSSCRSMNMDRAYQIGQTKQVYVFCFITEGSVGDRMLERAAQKLLLDQLVIQQGRQQQFKGKYYYF